MAGDINLSPRSPTSTDGSAKGSAKGLETHGGRRKSWANEKDLSPRLDASGPDSPSQTASQKQLNEYREKLARDLERRELSARGLLPGTTEKTRVSPIQEESFTIPPHFTSATATTASTDSGHTVRGAPSASTPSYPFPRMAMGSMNMQRHFNQFSPVGAARPPHMASFEPPMAARDRVLSNDSTPASTFAFDPSGGISPHPDNFDLPNPNLYELSLMLSSEPGLDAWWNTVVQIMKDVYHAERVTLAVPADTTDIENVPWGQKATYNEHHEDDLSLGYMARGSSAMPNSEMDVNSDLVLSPLDSQKAATPLRPDLSHRHSFSGFGESINKTDDNAQQQSNRPSYLRSRSYFANTSAPRQVPEETQLNKNALREHDLLEGQQELPAWEAPFSVQHNNQGRVLPVLQALDYEADPLIDHSGVMRVLERGKAVALTRTYPYLENPTDINSSAPTSEPAAATNASADQTGPDASRKAVKPKTDSPSKLTSIFGGPPNSRGPRRGKTARGEKSKLRLDDQDPPRPLSPKYEEYEQAPLSPWSQSPAPSPAVRADPKENPFFTDAMVDEDSFNPSSAPQNYSEMPPPEAIGVDNSWTVLHIPLTYVLLSKPTKAFRLNADAVGRRLQSHRTAETESSVKMEGRSSPASPTKAKPAPIAILSILSPLIPYPSNLRHSLEHLAPHLATSFSMCRQYSNLETELAGLQRRRPSTTGFGAVAPDGRPLTNATHLGSDTSRQQSIPETMTSPSDYSGVSKSMTASPAGTPGLEPGSLSHFTDRRAVAVSPAAISHGGESYFTSKRGPSGRHEVTASILSQKTSGSKDSSPGEKRQSRLSSTKFAHDLAVDEPAPETAEGDAEDVPARAAKSLTSKDGSIASPPTTGDGKIEGLKDLTTEASQADSGHAQHAHTLLHSYGADFASTFQSLPSSSTLLSRPSPMTAGSVPRGMSFASSAVVDMPPPSDKLKGLMLDALPAHVFVALPQTGEVVWVNSRFLSYRGQTVADLAEDPWKSIHPDDFDEYLKDWSHSLRTGEQFSRTVRIRRFDGAYRWFYARAVASKDKRGVIMQFLGSYMDIHDQHIAELKAARQEEIEASEAKHRLLANLIPQIIFTATEEDGITFANEQWLSYAGQSFDDCLGLGFLDFVHPDDLAKCRIPMGQSKGRFGRRYEASKRAQQSSTSSGSTPTGTTRQPSPGAANSEKLREAGSARIPVTSAGEVFVTPLGSADLTELARKGVIKVGNDSNGRLSYTTEVRLRSKSGEYRWHLIRCVEIDTIDFGSGASSYFGSATDINDHKLLEAKLKEAMESKGRFLSNMSHEIRTPLIGISGMVSFLQDTVLNDEQRDYTNTIQTSANSLIMIINDILDLSKVDAGMMKLKFEWFHTRSLIEDVNELVSTMAIAKGLELNYLVEADVPAWVKGDKVRIRQVLLNVIGNAIKFTAKGEVFSRCRVFRDSSVNLSDREIILEYAIIDTGQGFTKKEAELIFKPFSQIDGSSTRQHGGSGLGLVISKQLVELHGGKMAGTAVPGEGSTFVFSARFMLPTLEDHPEQTGSPGSTIYTATSRQPSTESVNRKPAHHLDPVKQLRAEEAGAAVHNTDVVSPEVGSNGSSAPSVGSVKSHFTDESSLTSVNTGLVRFSEAAKASGQDLSQMKLEIPTGQTATPDSAFHAPLDFRPPMYSILIICPQVYSRQATAQHIEMTLPKDVPHQITSLGTMEEAQELISGEDAIRFTHIVINLGSAEAVVSLMDQITKAQKIDKTTILVLSDAVQRQDVMKIAANTPFENMLSQNLVTFIYKPVKPSRFAVIFDPEKMRDVSIDRNRSTAQRMVENQKASYQEIERRMGHKGHRVLLVEDNPVNQKVLKKYLEKIGVDVDVAVDGVECIDKVLSRSHEHYSLILVSLQL
jgi:signal transduction histidine kinase